MARPLSPEKRSALLQAAIHEIAAAGLSVSTSRIAKRAGVAEGTLFTYFATKEQLLNELYLELKAEIYRVIHKGFPVKGSLRDRAWHVWSVSLDWAIAYPEKRSVSMRLNLSEVLTEETRVKSAAMRGEVDSALAGVEERIAAKGLPKGFASSMMGAMQDAAMEYIAKKPRQRESLKEKAFDLFWRALQ